VVELSEEKIAEVAFELLINGCFEKLDEVVNELKRKKRVVVMCRGEKLVFERDEKR